MPKQIMGTADSASSFEIKIDFEKHSDHPSRVFSSMALMIESFQLIDNDLLVPFDLRAESFLLLEDIKTGSLRTVLTTMLKSVDDEALKSGDWKKLVGDYLLKSKYKLLSFLENKTQITERGEIQKLETEIQALAQETNVRHLPSYKRVPLNYLLRDIGEVTKSLVPLKPTDTAKFITKHIEINFNQSFQYHEDSIETLLTKEVKTIQETTILKVKKPDYLGESMWDFHYRNHIIYVKIEDHNWLLKFQSRKEDVRPGDALSVILQTEISYGFHGEEVAVHYRILKVNGIVSLPPSEQGNLLST
jgi:hypothetical protein